MAMISSLNPEQKQAVEHGEGPLLIIAGAGTGKTTVVTERITHLILKKEILPSEILALTFTEKAAHEMQERVDIALPYGYTDMWIETFHAFCERVLRHEAIHIGLTPNFMLMTEAETLLFLRKHLFDFSLNYFRPMGNPTKFLQGMLTHFSRLKDDDISPDDYLTYAEKLAKNPEILEETKEKTLELARAFGVYEAVKAKEGVMDFSDLISNTLRLFRERKNIRTEFQQRFKYILVDEFQDTNYAQNEMAILLAGEKKNITVVGDDDQSIYRWRGAAIANMMQFRSHFPNAAIISLTKNYRSSQTILNSAYQMIQHNNPDRLEVREQIDKKLTAMGEKTEQAVEFIYTTRGEDEAEEVAKLIRDDVKKTNRPYNEYAILVRANDHSTPFQRALERQHIPYQFLGPGHLFQQSEIKDLISYLRILANFEDNPSLYRVITMPIFGMKERDIALLMNTAKKYNFSLFEAMEILQEVNLTPEGKEKTERIVSMIKRHLEKVPSATAGQLLYYFFEDSGLLSHYLDPGMGKQEREALNIAKFFTKIQSFETNREDASVFAVVDWIDLSMELGESPLSAEVDWTNTNAVNILTIHSSKGLEFPVVFVVNLVTQRFPGRDRKEQIPVPPDLIKEELPEGDENLQEERRLCYVALTRAKEKLYLTASKFYGEAKRERKLSPFIVESLGEDYVNRMIGALKETQNAEQLTLLDIMNDHVAKEEEARREAERILPTIPPITYISYSQLQTFQMCPLHYKLRYLLQVPTPTSPALNYGMSVHNTLRDFCQKIRQKEAVTDRTMTELFKQNWIRGGYAGKTHEEKAFTQAEKMLGLFALDYLEKKYDTVAIELPFQFRLKTLKAGGRIDRIDRLPDGRIEIIDYKTGGTLPDKKKLKEDLQLTFYALAATEIQDNLLKRAPDEIVLTLYYLEGNQKFSVTRTKEQLDEAKEKILDLVSQIQTSHFSCTGSIFCKNCEYKMLCSTHVD
jgi:DNA helicase II / ATP-dependent DNA helicase PcrA